MDHPSLRWDRFCLTILLIALAVRLVPVLLSINLGIGLDDMFQYDMLARSLVGGSGYRWYAQPDLYLIQPYIQFDFQGMQYDPRGVETSFRAPAYPFFLSGIYLLSGLAWRFFAVRLAQALIGALLAPLTYLLALQLVPGQPKAAKIAAWLIAFYPLLILYPLGLATENLFFTLVLAAVLATLWAVEQRGRRGWVIALLAGVMWGLSALTRSVVLPAGILAAGWLWFSARQKRKAGLALAVMLAVMIPWAVRNTALYGHFTWVETSLGYNLYVTNHPLSSGTFNPQVSFDLLKIMDDDVRNRAGMEAFQQWLAQNPLRILVELPLNRLGYFFGLEKRALSYFYSNGFFGYIPQPWLGLAAAVLLLPFVVTAVSAALSLPLLRYNKALVLVGLVLVGYLLPHLVTISEERFHLLIVPFLAVLAAQVWTRKAEWQTAWRSPTRRWLAAAAVLCAVLLVLNWGLELARDAPQIVLLMGPNGNEAHFFY